MASSTTSKTPAKTPGKARGARKAAPKSKSSAKQNSERADSIAESETARDADSNASQDDNASEHSSPRSTPEPEQEEQEEQEDDMDMDEKNYGTDGAVGDDRDVDSVPPPTPVAKPSNNFKAINDPPTPVETDMAMCDCATVTDGPPFVAGVRNALKKNLYRDLVLKSSDNKIVKAHKVILIPQSELLTKMFTKHPTKKEALLPFPGSVVKAVLRYSYNGNYSVDPNFDSEWDLKESGKGASDIEYHFKALQLAAFMVMPKFEELAGNKLKTGLKKGEFGHKLYAKLQELPAKKVGDRKPVPEVPFAVTEAVIEGGARLVKKKVDEGIDLNEAFHAGARTIDSRFLADFIQAIGNALGQQFRLYLRCPHCACHIRSKEVGSVDFACIRDDCGEKGESLGRLLLDDRIANPFIQAAPVVAAAVAA